MTARATDDTGERVEQESSPSTGAQATAAVMNAAYGLGRYESLRVTDGEDTVEQAVLRTDYKKDYFGVSS
jgi:hypothetical protein